MHSNIDKAATDRTKVSFGAARYILTFEQVEDIVRQRLEAQKPAAKPRRRTDLLATKEAAAYLGLSPRTLEDWRTKADATGAVQGPKVTRSGGRVFYRLADLDAFQTAESDLTAGQARLKQQRRKVRRIRSSKLCSVGDRKV